MDTTFTTLHFSSLTPEWVTPDGLFNQLDSEFHFTLDVCATIENTKCDQCFTEQIDGLNQEWDGACWMNPPYGRSISKWIEKAYRESLNGITVVCLLPARTDTRWFHEYCAKSNDIRFIKGRLKFNGSKHNAPFPSMIVVFK